MVDELRRDAVGLLESVCLVMSAARLPARQRAADRPFRAGG